MRGALQPRLGVVLTALLFSLLHVQYSWFGMATVFLFGLMLGAIRSRTNTTVVIAIHTIYDVLALFTT
jgi:membrane protease YdiL (CAAX protease family)